MKMTMSPEPVELTTSAIGFKVASSSGETYYVGVSAHCSCPQGAIRNRPCKHGDAILQTIREALGGIES
jgi:hypothetical protein